MKKQLSQKQKEKLSLINLCYPRCQQDNKILIFLKSLTIEELKTLYDKKLSNQIYSSLATRCNETGINSFINKFRTDKIIKEYD